MHYFWLCTFFVLLVYRMCFPHFKGYDCIIFSCFIALVFSVTGAAVFVQCALFLAAIAVVNVVCVVQKTSHFSGRIKDEYCILLCEAGEGIFAVLHGTRVEIGAACAGKKYRRGDVVKICAYNKNNAVSVGFI